MREMKDSGIEWIGEIPVQWNLVQTKRFFTNTKKIVGAKADNYDRLALTLNGVIKRSKDDSEGLQPEKFEGYQILCKNELVFKLIDLENVKTSRVGLSPYTGLVSPAYIVLSNNFSDNRFFYHWFMSMYYNEVFNHLGGEGVRSALNAKDVLSLPVPDIQLDEQRRIADYLDRKCSQIDTIIARQQEVIEKLKAYKLSVITEAVTKGLNPDVPMKNSGVEWIGKIPEHWAIHKFCWDYSAMLGKMLDAKRITGEHLHPYIKNADVQWDSINFEDLDEMDFSDEEKERYTISPGDLMVCEGGEIGKCAIVPDDIPEDIYYQKALHRVRKRHPDSGNIHFLCKVIYCMAKNNCLNTSPEKATIAHLPGDALSQLRIPTPPISEQGQIAEYLNDKCMEIDRFSARKHETIDKLIEYKKSLIYEVVTGKKEV